MDLTAENKLALNSDHRPEHPNSRFTNCRKSPKLSCYRRQIPLRSLENTKTGLKLKQPGMVCNTDHPDADTHKVEEDCFVIQPEPAVSVSSSACPSCGKSSPRISSPRECHSYSGMMVRNNDHRRSVECSIYENSGSVSSRTQSDKSKMVTNSHSNGTSGVRIKSESFGDFYDVEEEIGRGKFAVVKRCRHKTSGRKYAAKFLRKRRKGKDARSDILQEIDMLEMALVHPRLVDLIEVFETSHDLIIVTEFAEGGELFKQVVMEDNFGEKETARLLTQILEGVQFLHERSIVHLDIKPQNILLTSRDQATSNIKLCDLGFARFVHSGAEIRDIIGTPDYVAPEVLSYEPIHTPTDMWSIGVLVYVMLTGCSPFSGDTKQETFLNISQVNLDFPEDLFADVSEHAIDFISKLLVRNPDERLTVGECLEHPWLQKTSSSSPIGPCETASPVSSTTSSPIGQRRIVTPPSSATGSPIGQRRALTPPSPDTLAEEPLKKCRCESHSPEVLATVASSGSPPNTENTDIMNCSNGSHSLESSATSDYSKDSEQDIQEETRLNRSEVAIMLNMEQEMGQCSE